MKNYQNVIVDGKEYGEAARKKSAFFNEGKWENFIKPHLPSNCDEMTFIDIGCNDGLYLKLAKAHGFETVLGIEENEDLREVTDKFVDEGEILYHPLLENIFRETFIADLPAADFVLFANVHYHLYVPVFLHLVNLLRHKTRYVIVVDVDSEKQARMHKCFRANNGLYELEQYFRGYDRVGTIMNIPTKGDPAPREGMYSVLFKTRVERVPINFSWGRAGRKFYAKVKRDMQQSGYVNKCGVRDATMTYPILLRRDNSVVDGYHRLAKLELEGAKTVLAEAI